MDEMPSDLIRRLLDKTPQQNLDEETVRIYAFYKEMREHGAQPEAFQKQFPGSVDGYRAVQYFAHALERNRDIVPSEPNGQPARLLGKGLGNGHYPILFRIGKGGMGEVYAGRITNDAQDGSLVAIKTLYTRTRIGEERDPVVIEDQKRLIVREAQSLKRVEDYTNVVKFRHAGYDPFPDDLIYIITEYIEGRSLDAIIGSRFPGPLPPEEVLWIIKEACKGLIAIHAAPPPPTQPQGPIAGGAGRVERGGKLLHRDIKPSNILMDRGGRVKLVDLGLAGPAGVTTLLWKTDAFSAPEQDPRSARVGDGVDLDVTADIYSLGKTFYSLLSQERNPKGRLPKKTDRRWAGVPVQYVDVILQATAQNPKMRYKTAARFLEALESLGSGANPNISLARVKELLGDENDLVNIWVAQNLASIRDQRSTPSPSPSKPPRPWPWVKRRKLLIGAGIGIASVISWGTWVRLTPPPPPPTSLFGTIEVTLWNPGEPGRKGVALTDPNALPLRKGDLVHITAKSNRPAYFYIIWIDAKGVPQPLYPWAPGSDWKTEEPEAPVQDVELPKSTENEIKGWGLKGESGMETIILLASESPRLGTLDFRRLLTGLPKLNTRNDDVIIWFQNDEQKPIADNPHQGLDVGTAKTVDAPLIQAKDIVRKAFSQYFPLIKAISFSNQAE